MGPTKTVGDRTITTAKPADACPQGIQQQPAGNGGSTGLTADTNSQHPVWDEDDVMSFCRGNSMASVERHAKEEQERNENINTWIAGTVRVEEGLSPPKSSGCDQAIG